MTTSKINYTIPFVPSPTLTIFAVQDGSPAILFYIWLSPIVPNTMGLLIKDIDRKEKDEERLWVEGLQNNQKTTKKYSTRYCKLKKYYYICSMQLNLTKV